MPARVLRGLLLLLLVPAIAIRFLNLSSPLVEPHPYRQTMSALVTQLFSQQGIDVFTYRSPDGGIFWNVMHEFPILQIGAVSLMQFGFSLETATRLTTLGFFFLGALFLYFILVQITNRSAAFWGVVCYLVSPYNIIYSRTGLVDFTAQCFVLGAVASAIAALKSESSRLAIISTILGTLGALVKCYIWFVPAGLGFTYLFLRQRRSPTARWLLSGLLIQFAITVSWILWTGHVRGPEWKALVSPLWIFGTMDQRLQLENWLPQFRWILRFVLNDWMVIPFFAACLSQQRMVVGFITAIILLPIIVLFNSSQHHDYYLMNQSPYIFMLVGIGWTEILRRKSGTQWLMVAVTALILIRSATKIRYTLGQIFHDPTEILAPAIALKTVSSPSDRIYLEGFNERFEMPLYSERLARPYFRERMGELHPTLLVFKDTIRIDVLREFGNAWLEEGDFHHFIPVRVAGTREFDPARTPGLMQKPGAGTAVQSLEVPRRLNLCSMAKPFVVFQIGEGTEIGFQWNSREIKLKGGRFLHLPKMDREPCTLELSYRTSRLAEPP